MKVQKYFVVIFLLAISLLGNTTLSGQDLEFEHLNKTNGLPSNYVTSIVQDKYGMMWFGTFNGLVRFDGYQYKVFVHDETDSLSLADNLIRSLQIMKDGKLLVSNENHGISIFDYETEKFTRYVHLDKDQNCLSNNNVISTLVDSKGIVWVGTWGGLNRFDPVTKKFHFYKINSNIGKHDESEFISSIVEEKSGHLLLFLTGSRIVRFNPPTQSYDFINIPDLPKPKLRLNRGGVLFLDKDGLLWIGSELNGISTINLKTMHTQQYNVDNGKIGSNLIMSFTQDKNGKLWIGTDGGGLLAYDYKTDSFAEYFYNKDNPNTISGNGIYCVYQSKEGHLWAGAYASGLNIIKSKKRKFKHFNNQGEINKKLSYKSVLSFAPGDSGEVLIGTDGGGLNIFNPANGNFRYYNTQNSCICSNVIKSVLKDLRGNIWMGTFGSGLCIANLTKNEFEHLTPFSENIKQTISHPNVWNIVEDKDSSIWIGFLDAGIDQYIPSTKEFVKFPYKDLTNTGARDGSIMSMLVDNKNNLWAGTESGGLCYLDPSRKNIVNFIKSKTEAGLPSNNITALMQDSKSRIWIGTKDGGLSLLTDFKNKQFKSYSKEEGLPGYSVNSIQEDLHGKLWLGTDNGLTCFDPVSEKFQNFDRSDGLQSMEFAKSASFKDQKGYLYFGGTDGFNYFHPDSIWFNPNIPEVYISGINLFNKSIQPGTSYEGKEYFSKPIHLLDTLNLSYSDYVFSIEFSCADYTSPEKNRFAYMLEGFDKTWNYVDATKRIATYTNLEPGKYLFKVKASNNDGVWNEKGTSLIITISPPWHSTWWFRSALATFLILSLVAFYYLRTRNIKRQNILLSNLVNEKTSELQNVNSQLVIQNENTLKTNKQLESQQEEIVSQRDELEVINGKLYEINQTKDKLFSIIGHDLRNPVSALTSLTGMLQQNYSILEEKDKLQILDHVQASATSLKLLVTNLLNWALVQGKNLHPEPEPISIYDIAKECFNLLKLHAIGKNILFENNSNPEHMVMADSEMLKTAIRNLVSNAIKFTERNGLISISTQNSQSGFISIMISDTGSGMDTERVSKLLAKEKIVSTKGTSEEKGSGIGLVIVREFIEANHGKLEVESTIGKGTTFTILLPAIKMALV